MLLLLKLQLLAQGEGASYHRESLLGQGLEETKTGPQCGIRAGGRVGVGREAGRGSAGDLLSRKATIISL